VDLPVVDPTGPHPVPGILVGRRVAVLGDDPDARWARRMVEYWQLPVTDGAIAELAVTGAGEGTAVPTLHLIRPGRRPDLGPGDDVLLMPTDPHRLAEALAGLVPGPVTVAQAPGTPAAGRRLRILLAEDHPVNQQLARTVLLRAGHEVAVAEDGGRALDLWSAGGFDLILMDCQMPVLDGYGAARRIRAAGGRLPIVALTASGLAEERARCTASGMDDLLAKPYRPEDLRRVVDAWAGRARG
jgi:CheY-like chemotaxis protein